MPKGMNVSYVCLMGFQVITLAGRSSGRQCVVRAEQCVEVASCLMIGLLPSTVARILCTVNSVYFSWCVVHHLQL